MFCACPDRMYSATARRLRSDSVRGGVEASTTCRDSSWPIFAPRRRFFPFFFLPPFRPPSSFCWALALLPAQEEAVGGGCGLLRLLLDELPLLDVYRPVKEEWPAVECSL